MYQMMGGKSLEDDVATILNDLQQSLNNVLEELAQIFGKRSFLIIKLYDPTQIFHFGYMYFLVQIFF